MSTLSTRLMIAAAVAVSVSGVATAAEEWRQYTFEDDGYLVEFPGEPEARTGAYSSTLLPEQAPTTYSYFEDENNIYSAAVVHGVNPETSASVLNEADYFLEHLGETVLNLTSRPGQGHYGRYVTIDCVTGIIDQAGGTRITDMAVQNYKDAAGIECVDGASLTAVLVYRHEEGGRLYMMIGINKPGSPMRTRVNAARFAFSLVWAGANASIVDIVQQYDVSPEEAAEILEGFRQQ